MEAQKYLLPRRELLVMVDLGTDLVSSNPDVAFEGIAEIYDVDDFSLKLVDVTRSLRLTLMD